jgi:magnesium transporter
VVKTALVWHSEVQLGETHIFVGPRFVVTVHHGLSVSYSKVRERLECTPEQLAKGPGMVAHAIIDFIVDNYRPVLETLQERFESLERDIFTGAFERETIVRIYDLKRQILRLRSAAAPVLDIADDLMRFHREIVSKEMRVYFRDIHDHAPRIVTAADKLREMQTAAMQVNLALVSVEQNEAVRRLAGWGAIFSVPTVIFSMYGMDFKEMPELGFHYGYPFVLFATIAGCVWIFRRLKRYGWL